MSLPDELSILPVHDVSSACPTLADNGFVFGLEDSRVIATDTQGNVVHPPHLGSPSGEAVNGIAVTPGKVAISTRSDIMFWTTVENPIGLAGATIPFGSHGVIATPNGLFVAPVGQSGLLYHRPRDADMLEAILCMIDDPGSFYFYRAVSFISAHGREVVVCAGRTTGIGAIEQLEGTNSGKFLVREFNGQDIVDVCPLTQVGSAIAAIARDGTLHVLPDMFTDQKAATIKFKSINGTAYRIFCARGYLFVLTSEALNVVADFVDPFLNGKVTNSVQSPVLTIPLRSIDATLVGSRWLLILGAGQGVLRLDIELFDKRRPRDIPTGFRKVFFPIKSLLPTPFLPTNVGEGDGVNSEWESGPRTIYSHSQPIHISQLRGGVRELSQVSK